MLERPKSFIPSKCYITHGYLPKYNNPDQPPSRHKPFSTVLQYKSLHTVDVVLPEQCYVKSWPTVQKIIKPVCYCRVNMRLLDVLSGPFFNVYIKTGNIMLQSEGRPGIDPTYSLHEGLLRLELPKDLYEKAGLVGSPIQSGGQKHVKTRFAVEFNLRLPSMLHGRKGFDRLIWACKNVLSQPLNWLFMDISGDSHDTKMPVAALNPLRHVVEPTISHKEALMPAMTVPDPSQSDHLTFQEDVLELREWLDMVALDSPDVTATNPLDPFLSRYRVPGLNGGTPQKLVVISWRGFLSAGWARDVLMAWLNATRKQPTHWCAMSGYALRSKAVDANLGWTVLCHPRAEILTGPIDGSETTDNDPVDSDVLQRPETSSAGAAKYTLYETSAGSAD